MIRAALALYEATGERAYLERALAWQGAFDVHYADPDTGGYYLSPTDADDLLLRPHSTQDDATPNPNAVAAGNLCGSPCCRATTAGRAQADRLIEGFSLRPSAICSATWRCSMPLDLRLCGAEIVVTGRTPTALPRPAQAAVPRTASAARRLRRRAAGRASGAGQDQGVGGQCRLPSASASAARCR